ncbi:MAG: hypothetical protein PHC62_00290 [Candidatus Izemoplasmatales bacterium]|nr:hypothetical protein [Candidatus Izemoplasmatales bacterium]
MAEMKSYGKISILNMTKVGTLIVNPRCNMPLTVVRDPDTNTYTPTWSGSNALVIDPLVTFDGVTIANTNANLEIIYQRQFGNDAAQNVVSGSDGETINASKALEVKTNKFVGASSKLLTYIMSVTYTDPKSKVPVNVQARLTFTLLDNPGIVKYIALSGENAILYNANQEVISGATITITANLTNVTMTGWQYKDASDTWKKYPGSTDTSASLTVKHDDLDNGASVFVNDVLTVKAITNVGSVFDILSIYKVRDGAAGGNSLSISLTNDSHVIPCDSNGVPSTYEGADTKVTIYEGGIDVSGDYMTTVTPNVTVGALDYNFEDNTKVFKLNSWTGSATVAYVTFTCTEKDPNNPSQPATNARVIIARMTFTKIKYGADGAPAVVYSLVPTNYALNRNISNVLTPNKVTFASYSKTGLNSRVPFNCKFRIKTTTSATPDIDGVTGWTQTYQSSSVESSYTMTSIGTTVTAIRAEMYLDGSFDTANLLDTQMVIITKDGQTGQPGTDGAGGITPTIGNDAELIPCNTDGKVTATKDVVIPFRVYMGTERIDATLAASGLVTGITQQSTTASTTTADGSLTLRFAGASTLGGTTSGSVTLTFSYTVAGVAQTAVRKFAWSKNIRAADGVNPVLFQIYNTGTDTIYNGQNNVTLQTQMVEGATIVNTATYQWSKLNIETSTYTVLTGKTASSLVVEASDVDGMAYFRCIATYKSIAYPAYYTVYDKTDPFQVYPYSSLGTQLLNPGDFMGAIFTRIYRDGVEADVLKSTIMSTTAPASPAEGDFYYHISKTAGVGKITLKKRVGTNWVDQATLGSPDNITYKYFKMDIEGSIVDMTTPWAQGKVIYFDHEDANPILDLTVMVTETT